MVEQQSRQLQITCFTYNRQRACARILVETIGWTPCQEKFSDTIYVPGTNGSDHIRRHFPSLDEFLNAKSTVLIRFFTVPLKDAAMTVASDVGRADFGIAGEVCSRRSPLN
jgi:hypothetical protein